MAAKSDFAQKLLNDLRLRKERMGMSQGSARNHATTRDAYRDPGNMQRRSRQTKSLESIGGSKSTNQRLISSRRSDQALNIKETSQQLVSYSGRQHQRSESIRDLSMAFTYAVKNGGKLMNVDFSSSGNGNTMIDFLNQIGRRSTGTTTSLVKHRPANSGVAPALTTIQIKEISKAVQNLYEIIRSTSNGTNVNRYSMEVGKELLKGAKGLEESLRMLVNLQEESDLMVNPQRKSRITLLEVDDDGGEDERSKIIERNQVALPRFSFDKPSKKSNFLFTESYVESVRSVSSAKPTSIRSEKGRISNVIAKLMGLEEIPVKDSCSRRDEIKKVDDSSVNMVNKTSRPVKDVAIPGKLETYSKRDEIKKADDLNKNTVKMISRPMKDRKLQQTHDSNANGESRTNQNNKNNRSDQNSKKQEKHSKRRNPEAVRANPVHEAPACVGSREAATSLQVEKTKTVRKEKSNQIQEPERRTQKSKQDSNQIKPFKNTNAVSKESNPHPFEGNQKVKDPTPKAREQERTQQKMVSVTRKKVDSVVMGRTESPRTKDEVLRRRNRTLNSLSTPSKHKILVLKEKKINEVCIRSKPEEINIKRSNSVSNALEEINTKRSSSVSNALEEINTKRSNSVSNAPEEINTKRSKLISNANEAELTTRSYDIVPVFENEIKSDPHITSEIVVAGKNAKIPYKSTLLENNPKKAFYSSIQVVLTEQEKQLKEILMKDQLFLSTAEALFKLNIPVGFLHADDHNHHNHETKLKLDCGYEILKRKARSQELSVHPYIRPSIADTSIRFLDELVKQLYKDLEGLRLYGRDTCNQYEADYLHHMLEKDIYNKNPDINSFWDFGWHITTFTFVEKDEFVSDVEQDMLCGLVDEIIDDLLGM
ncbi:hypothetical protein L1987_08609 [Smallanthus sonchifolius]|uniref:Uncharacterized protein n=1 Tax=Smallanthus sonchifolius TaxID=185202 RepID=A0ACB9JM88_9ASTR|nr:hypothetical protein L1987_08609 [Smallanthus sonchifolius]